MDIVEEYITTITRKHNHPQGNEEYMDIELKVEFSPDHLRSDRFGKY
jgi:hypothetical protein